MELTSTHTFDAPVERVWEMFHDPRSHVAKFELMGHRDIEVLDQERTDDRLRIEVSRVVDVELPGFAKRFLKPTNTVVSTDVWERRDEATCGGEFSASAKGAPVSVAGTTLVEDQGDGTSLYTIRFEISVSIPMMGGKIASFAEGDARRQLEQEYAAGDAWLTEH